MAGAEVWSPALLVIGTYMGSWLRASDFHICGDTIMHARAYDLGHITATVRRLGRLDRLGEGEHAGWVVASLDLGEPTVVSTVVGLAPVGQGGVDVVLVRLTAGVGAHRLPERLLPRVLAGYPGGRG